MDINAKIATCLQPIKHVGYTIFQNVCDGTLTTVPWGSAQWAEAVALAAVFVIVFGVFAGICVSAWRRSTE